MFKSSKPPKSSLSACTHAATALRYSVRAPPTPTPSCELSPPTEMSTGGLNSEQVARACTSSTSRQQAETRLAARSGTHLVHRVVEELAEGLGVCGQLLVDRHVRLCRQPFA